MESFNLDARQLARIEAVHRGFLYQHSSYLGDEIFLSIRHPSSEHVLVEP